MEAVVFGGQDLKAGLSRPSVSACTLIACASKPHHTHVIETHLLTGYSFLIGGSGTCGGYGTVETGKGFDDGV